MGDSPEVCKGKDPLPTLDPFEVWLGEAIRSERATAAARLDNIATEALKYRGSMDWAYSANRPPYGPDTNKCNLFVYEVLKAAGTPVPMKARWSLRKLVVQHPPLAGQWADPSVNIPGWVVLTVPPDSPQRGDVAAEKGDYSDASGHERSRERNKCGAARGGKR